MIESLTITVLVENTAGARGLLGEHGLSLYIKADDLDLLFDTGQGLTLRHNAEQLGIDLDTVPAIAISHGHYDHTGGLLDLLQRGPRRRLYLHPEALSPKYNRHGQDIGANLPDRERLGELAEVNWTTGVTWLTPNVCLTGEIPRQTAFEDNGGPFYLDPQGTTPDPLRDDQALVIDSKAGLVVVLGCGHAGVINTLNHVQRLTSRPIHALIGGMHLLRAAQDRLHHTVQALADWDIRYLVPIHCTGVEASGLLWTRFPGRCLPGQVGTRLAFTAEGGPSASL